LISDNASDHSTREVVASFDDERIDYVRSPVNIGMTPNINRIIALAETDFLVVLPDDDILYPNYLESALAVFDDNPAVGVVHTAFDLMDDEGNLLQQGWQLVDGHEPIGVEPGSDLIERSMRTSGLACWTSCLFRTNVIRDAGSLRADDEPFADGPLMMRIGVDWDVGWIADPLVAVRMHELAVSATAGSYSQGKYEPDITVAESLLRQRMRFLEEARLPAERVRHYRSIALETHRRHAIGLLWEQVGLRRSRGATLGELFSLGRSDPRMLLVPGMLKLLAALVVGRPIEFLRYKHHETHGAG
jgi:glycosyltransferase involved in cell wall biosynthesis